MNDIVATPQQVLDYWFGEKKDEIDLPSAECTERWFAPSEKHIKEITEKFSETVKAGHAGELNAWREDPHHCVALVIVLHVFANLIHGDSLFSYECDLQALDVCMQVMEAGEDHELSLMQRVFLYLPLRSSEDLQVQDLSLDKFDELQKIALPDTKLIYESIYEAAESHYNVILSFARFPWWNDALGRESTQEELEYLKSMREH